MGVSSKACRFGMVRRTNELLLFLVVVGVGVVFSVCVCVYVCVDFLSPFLGGGRGAVCSGSRFGGIVVDEEGRIIERGALDTGDFCVCGDWVRYVSLERGCCGLTLGGTRGGKSLFPLSIGANSLWEFVVTCALANTGWRFSICANFP